MPYEFGKEWDDPEDWIDDEGFAREANAVISSGLNDLCQKIGRILTGIENLTVEGFDSLPRTMTNIPSGIPGLTANKVIYLNHGNIESMSEGSLEKRLRLTIGVFLHELGHVDFTPTLTNDVFKEKRKEFVTRSAQDYIAVRNSDYAFNMLEDQRQELLEGTRYPKARDYYRLVMIAMIRKAIGESKTIGRHWYALYYGRRHLFPARFVKKMEQASVAGLGAAQTDRIKQIITEFQHLPSRGKENLEKMQELSWELAGILGNNTPESQSCNQSTKGAPRMRQGDEDKIREQAENGMGQLDKDRAGDTENNEESGERGQGGDERPDGSKEKREENGGGVDGDSIEDALGSLSQLEEKIAERLLEDLEDKMDSLQDHIASGYDELKDGKDDKNHWAPTTKENDDARRIANYFKDIAIDLKQQYFRNLKKGRLDTRKLSSALASNSVRLFKRRQPDISNMASMAVHVAFDASGSMGGFWKGEDIMVYDTPGGRWSPQARYHYVDRYSNGWLARSAAYVISKAAEWGGHYSRVSVFGTETHNIKGWNDKEFMGNRTAGIGGSTNPTKGFQRAIRDFAAICDAKGIQNKVYIIVTDGEFDNTTQDVKLLRILKRLGCHIYIMGIGFTPAAALNEFNIVTVPNADSLEESMKTLLKELSFKITREVRRGMM